MKIEHRTSAHANVFADLGLADADNLRLRAELMMEISRYIKEKKISQAEAASMMGTTQPRISNILNGDINKCSIDRMVKMLSAVGRHVEMTIKVA